MTHMVTRPFEGARGKVYQPGEAVDASVWAHTAKLVEQRRLRPLTPKEARQYVDAERKGGK
jgi:hypothetical protein